MRRRNIYLAKTKLRIGPMISFDSKYDDIVGGLLLKKHTAIGSNFDLWLKIATSAEVNTRTKQVGLTIGTSTQSRAASTGGCAVCAT